MAGTQHHRYYAYEAKAGGIVWMQRIVHLAIVRHPDTIGLHQCVRYTGKCQLMTTDAWKATRRARTIAQLA